MKALWLKEVENALTATIKVFVFCLCNFPEHQDCLHHAVHERLGELLRVLKAIISKHQSLNSVDILSTAGTVIATVKGELWWPKLP